MAFEPAQDTSSQVQNVVRAHAKRLAFQCGKLRFHLRKTCLTASGAATKDSCNSVSNFPDERKLSSII